jgi:hypothetical protein
VKSYKRKKGYGLSWQRPSVKQMPFVKDEFLYCSNPVCVKWGKKRFPLKKEKVSTYIKCNF